MNIYQRYLAKGDTTWYARFRAPHPAMPGRSKVYLRCTFTSDKVEAQKRLQAMYDTAQGGRFDLLDLTKARREVICTLGMLFTLYRQGARFVKKAGVAANINALSNLVRRAMASTTLNVEKLTLNDLTPDLMWKWKQAMAKAIDADGVDEMRGQQIARSANSILRMTKSIFTRDMMVYYEREGRLKLPDALRKFITEPPLKNAGKVDYYPPSDIILGKTFDALEALRDTDRNMYLAIWLALGFGLRKGEIAQAKVDWLIQRSGVTYLRGDRLAKNGTLPDVIVQLGAWQKLQPLLQGRQPEHHILAGTDTERHEDTFRRISAWMRSLGWETQKTVHEFRAYSGCKVAEVHGLLAARQWMRHASYLTTEKYYGRYIRMRIAEVPLNIPGGTGPFVPTVIPGHEAAS